ncbi:hypothetical protein KY289_013487 [Solanum tuberosum]|nr:hypothetical protein KY289_013487 [Solanum tuberosum]
MDWVKSFLRAKLSSGQISVNWGKLLVVNREKYWGGDALGHSGKYHRARQIYSCVIYEDYLQPRRKAKQQASQPRRKAKGVVIATEVATPQTTLHKPPQASGKNQVLDDTSSNDSMEIDSIQFTSSIFENEEVVGSGTPVYTLVPEAKMTKRKGSPLHSKASHDPLALPSAPQASQAP